MREPKRCTDIDALLPYVRDRVLDLLKDIIKYGFDPVVFETRRSYDRQEYLYSIGRTRFKQRKPVTWTLHSKHQVGKAVDIISATHGWDSPTFYIALGKAARKFGLHQTSHEPCHIEWLG